MGIGKKYVDTKYNALDLLHEVYVVILILLAVFVVEINGMDCSVVTVAGICNSVGGGVF